MSFDLWRERFNHTVMRGQRGIPILNDSNAFQKVGYIFNVRQTTSMDRNVNEAKVGKIKSKENSIIAIPLDFLK